MSSNNLDFAHAVIHNTDNATEMFKSDPEALMDRFELSTESRAKLQTISDFWTSGQANKAATAWGEWSSEFIGPELASGMRW